jgi:poly-beta-1,6-N-acetyl-D-glucosamine synthase
MTVVFWLSIAFVLYTYFGYPAWLWLRATWGSEVVHTAPFLGSISIVMVVRNEASILETKLRSLTLLNYPANPPEIIVVSDGSTDRTNDILQEFSRTYGLHIVLSEHPRGKASGLNNALKVARAEVVVFMDVRQQIEPDAVKLLIENFADPKVGCVSGELMLGEYGSVENISGLGLYWKFEKSIRELEGRSGVMIGATGALYAVRRNLLTELPDETILDDVYLPMQVLRQGKWAVFESGARAWDIPNQGTNREIARKVRTLSGNYQLLQLAPWLLSRANPARFEFVSHKLMRLLVPFALCSLLISSFLIQGRLYRVALVMQLFFYGLALFGLINTKPSPAARIADAACTFVVLNAAAVIAFANFVSGRKIVWDSVRR